MATVDVIIPTRNRLELTSEAIESVQSQTFGDWRLWVMDDASDDGSARALAHRFRDDERVLIIEGAKLGAEGQREAALELGQAPWVAMLDSDDLWQPEKLRKQFAMAAQADMVLSWYEWFRPDGSVRKTGKPFIGNEPSPLGTNNMSIPLIRRSWLEAVGGFDRLGLAPLTTCDNIELFLRLLPNSRTFVVPETLVRCRDHDGTRSSSASAELRGAQDMERMLGHHRAELSKWPAEHGSLLASAGARFISAGEQQKGLELLLDAWNRSPRSTRVTLLLRYGPFLLKRSVQAVLHQDSGS